MFMSTLLSLLLKLFTVTHKDVARDHNDRKIYHLVL